VANGGVNGRSSPVRPVRPIPRQSRRPWAGRRLAGTGVGELWVADPAAIVEGGRDGGLTLDELADRWGEAFVGTRALARLGPRFPLLVKFIDTADWLSIQVHPSDALAAELYGPGHLGKTEAWVILEADPESRLVTGPRRDLEESELRATIRAGRLGREHCEDQPARAGDSLLIPAGTIHAIGAGVLLYEIEEASDITFRISDWGRPPSPERPLHIAESLRAVAPESRAVDAGTGWKLDGGAIDVPEFRLEIARIPEALPRSPAGDSLHVLTAIRGRARIVGHGWVEGLEPFQTVVVPASDPGYRIEGPQGGLVCVGSIP